MALDPTPKSFIPLMHYPGCTATYNWFLCSTPRGKYLENGCSTVVASASKSVGNVDLNAVVESQMSLSKSRKQTLSPDRYYIFLQIK